MLTAFILILGVAVCLTPMYYDLYTKNNKCCFERSGQNGLEKQKDGFEIVYIPFNEAEEFNRRIQYLEKLVSTTILTNKKG